ncbi:MAG: YkgJ family cysteine cluster protein [Desulfobulbaceae bacterium]|uniref:YkgJ family cysteine cluster protein n=1 Tax=Candidatus Desulfatifera sulfidica TaxID=2841691 RepID=A0A8J6TB55_9BACT|nr:YkgJ family cysteine cluster protein [Candidatus Desulfatifera sulfidica]
MSHKQEFPEGMEPLGKKEFTFSCHSGVECFTLCCRNVDMILYPYDILRLKNCLGVDSQSFMQKHTRLVQGVHPYFPTVMLRLTEEKDCPFLAPEGCTVYRDRPSACRTYPLERAVDRNPAKGREQEFYFLTDHSYCLGHKENVNYTVKSWIRDQRLHDFNAIADLWTAMDTLFATNPWRGEGANGPKQQLAFMVCYDIDGFRQFAEEQELPDRFRLDKSTRKRIVSDDVELLKFGFEWLKLIFGGQSSLLPK